MASDQGSDISAGAAGRPDGTSPADEGAPTAVPRADTVISVDALGGDAGVAPIVDGMWRSARKNPDISFVVHGDVSALEPLIARRPQLAERCLLNDVRKSVSMGDKPSRVLRTGKDTSMWAALDSVRSGVADVAVSCGNTGALMALSMLRLRKAPGVNRPAIAVLWPSRTPGGYSVVLDVGADIRADAEDLLQYALMGAAYSQIGQDVAEPRVGLLNVGTEEHKGRTELHEAAELIEAAAESGGYRYVGYVEGSDIPSGKVDVVVSDGFTGNIALKTAEGTATLTRDLLKEAFKHSIFSQLGALFAVTSLRRLSKRMDPRRVNGGVFLGLNGVVVKSHGSADATGISAAIRLAFLLSRQGFGKKMQARLASANIAAPAAAQGQLEAGR